MPPASESRPSSPFLPILISIALYLSGLFSLFTPLPLVFAFLRYGKRDALLRVILPTAVGLLLLYLVAFIPLHTFYELHPQWSWLLSFPGGALLSLISFEGAVLFGITYFALFAVIAFSIYRVLLSPASLTSTLGALSFALVAAVVAGVFMAGHLSGESPVSFLDRYFRTSLTEALSLSTAGSLSSREAVFFRDNLDTLVFYSTLFSPSFVFCSLLMMILLNLVIGRRIFAPLVPVVDGSLSLTRWSLPFAFVWGVIALLVLLLANSFLVKSTLLVGIAGNGLIAAGFLTYLQGISIVADFFGKKNVRPSFRIAGYAVLILFFQILGVVVMALGFFDHWFNFRKISPGRPQKSD